ncbi:tyrosine phosphatase Pyp1 [Schizosaccharomyces cryophilus OY26]|uniref:protein-tyrosine-phosphatase n=1 Tax=Schizosaccharomyces cryophilus (strain OY26 / ATCC MYA-4695 / CBS 11777 / NBRC 106824 / NRRL Y48691) TaxID=653667 RepID=S9VQI0_SCHCR|nr:tyrosine phosphatase Pyp1 [Schizosaccharomyces cryophilus OY26]EPY50218.1 tyrosine phosphatase Pyp1 [Schizosaccharomyces cryophilus OY26]
MSDFQILKAATVTMEPPSGSCTAVLPKSYQTTSKYIVRSSKLLDYYRNTEKHSDVLIIDLRPVSEFSKDRINGSVNLTLPATLIKRPAFSASRIISTLNDADNVCDLSKGWKDLSCIFVCLPAWVASHITIAEIIGEKFKKECFSGTFGILDLDYNRLANTYPDLIDRMPITNKMGVNTSINSKLNFFVPQTAPISLTSQGSDYFSSVPRPKDKVEMLSLNKFFCPMPDKSINNAPLRTPSLHSIPDAFTNPNVTILYEKFSSLEFLEQQRLACCADKNSKWCTVDSLSNLTYKKNRYTDIVPYNLTRVHLKNKDTNKGTDYINASYVNTATSKFIACQASLTLSLEDFWQMTWDHFEDIGSIVMLGSFYEAGREMSVPYWPQDGVFSRQTYGLYTVTLLEEKNIIDSGCILRKLDIRRGDSTVSKKINHFQYENWTDCNSPERVTMMINFLKLVNSYDRTGPLVVHCSAGVGRTGTFIVLDALLRLPNEKFSGFSPGTDVSSDVVFQQIDHVRTQRMKMVQSFTQFKFIYDLIDFLQKNNTKFPVLS